MALYTVALKNEISFAPENETAEILQNVRHILNTRIGTAPLQRGFGISWEHLDKPRRVAEVLMRSAIVEAVESFEPRAKVVSVQFKNGLEDELDGVLHYAVTVAIGEEE